MIVISLASCGSQPAETSAATTEATTVATTEATQATTEATTEATTTGTPTVVVEEGVAGHWIFDSIDNGVIKDISGHGHDAEVNGKPEIVEIDGGYAIKLSDSGEHMDVANSDDFCFDKTDDFTLSMRFKWDGTFPESWACPINVGLMTKGASLNYNYIGIWINTSGQCVIGRSTIDGTACYNTTILPDIDNEWHEIIYAQDGTTGTIEVFVDGDKVLETESISTISTQPIFIGYNGNDGNQGQFIGLIDEVIIYDHNIFK